MPDGRGAPIREFPVFLERRPVRLPYVFATDAPIWWRLRQIMIQRLRKIFAFFARALTGQAGCGTIVNSEVHKIQYID